MSETFDTPLTTILRERTEADPERLACTFLDDHAPSPVRRTYADLDRQARALAAELQDRHEPGTRVLLLYPPGIEFLIAFLGCLYARVVPATAYPPRPGQSLTAIEGILSDCGAAEVLTTGVLGAHLDQRTEAGEQLSAPLRLTDRVDLGAAAAWRDPGVGPEDLAFLQYTSGSTGEPKGVMVSHRGLVSTCTDVHRGFSHTPDSVMVSWLPTFHDMGLIYGVLLPLMVGFPTFLMAPVTFLRKPVRWLQAISEHRGTHTSAPNFAYELCLRKVGDEELSQLDLSSWRVAANGAEAVRQETHEGFLRRFAPCGVRDDLFCPSYGLAEVGLKVATGRQGDPALAVRVDREALEEHRLVPLDEDDPAGTTLVGCGFSQIGARIEIVDPSTHCLCPSDRIGEIWVASTSVAEGYWQRPELSEQVFRARTADGEGPFLRTGDLGFLYEGQLFIAGRIKDLVVIRGRNYYSHDIERTAEEADGAFRPGCGAAFGVTMDGEERLVVAQEVRTDAEKAPDELLARIRKAIVRSFGIKPYAVVLVPPGGIPKTSSGKIRRPISREDYLAGRLPSVADWREETAKG